MRRYESSPSSKEYSNTCKNEENGTRLALHAHGVSPTYLNVSKFSAAKLEIERSNNLYGRYGFWVTISSKSVGIVSKHLFDRCAIGLGTQQCETEMGCIAFFMAAFVLFFFSVHSKGGRMRRDDRSCPDEN